MLLETSQPRAHIVNHWNLWYITLSIFHLSDLKSVLGNSLRITFCRKSPLQSTLEKMQMGPCKTWHRCASRLDMPQRSHQPVDIWEPLLDTTGSGLGWGWRAGQTSTDVMSKGTFWRFLQDLKVSRLFPVTNSAWLALANSCFWNRLIHLFFTISLLFLALTLKLSFLTLKSRVTSAELPLQIEFKSLWPSLTSPARCPGEL